MHVLFSANLESMEALEAGPQVDEQVSDGDALAADWHEMLGRYHRTTCALDRALMADHRITVSDFEVLQQLYAANGCLRMHELAEQVHLTQSALSRLITRLEKAGLVTRGMCEDDRRAVWTEMTAAGKQCFVAARPTHRSILLEQASGGVQECVAEAEQTT
jgi:DNA-binding MarR family transcriptional regulator